jgi:hypothetical protein
MQISLTLQKKSEEVKHLIFLIMEEIDRYLSHWKWFV